MKLPSLPIRISAFLHYVCYILSTALEYFFFKCCLSFRKTVLTKRLIICFNRTVQMRKLESVSLQSYCKGKCCIPLAEDGCCNPFTRLAAKRCYSSERVNSSRWSSSMYIISCLRVRSVILLNLPLSIAYALRERFPKLYS